MQYAFHAWREGTDTTECYNPTQAGARIDDQGVPAPFHGPSTSALDELSRQDIRTVRTASRPAMFITRSDPHPGWAECRAVDYQPNRSPYSHGLSPYLLDTTIQLAPDHQLAGLENVIRLSATLTSEDDLHRHFDGVLISYLQRDFTAVYSYDHGSGRLTARPANQHAGTEPAVRCTADGRYCLGMYFRPGAMPGAYYYTMTRGALPSNGMFGESTMQVTMPASGIGRGGVERLQYELFLAVGNRDRVADTLGILHTRPG